jgi:hypothetical protein
LPGRPQRSLGGAIRRAVTITVVADDGRVLDSYTVEVPVADDPSDVMVAQAAVRLLAFDLTKGVS